MRLVSASVAASFAIFAFGCGVEGTRPAEAPPKTVSGYGLSVAVPAGWSARIYRPEGPNMAIVVSAQRLGYPSYADVVVFDDPPNVEPGSSYVEIYDLGPPPEHIGREGAWRVDPPLPLAVERHRLRGPYKGGFPFGIVLPVVIADRALEIHVLFGARPTSEQLDEANDLLASLTVEPTA